MEIMVKLGKTHAMTNTWGKIKTHKDKKVESKRISCGSCPDFVYLKLYVLSLIWLQINVFIQGDYFNWPPACSAPKLYKANQSKRGSLR